MGHILQDNEKICENICHPVFMETCVGNITQWWKREMEVTIGNKGNDGQTFQLFFCLHHLKSLQTITKLAAETFIS